MTNNRQGTRLIFYKGSFIFLNFFLNNFWEFDIRRMTTCFEGCLFLIIVFIFSLFSSAQDGWSFHDNLPQEFYSSEYLSLFLIYHWRLSHQSRSKLFLSLNRKNMFQIFKNSMLSTWCRIDIMSVLTSIVPFHVWK